LPGIGALDVHTVGGDVRLIGNIVVEVSENLAIGSNPQSKHLHLVGFENHSGRTYLGSGVQALGRVISGHGNNGEDGSEGAVFRNAIGCYMHGSLLPKNPQLADHLISLALRRRYGPDTHISPIDDTLELRAQRVMVRRFG
jgi:hypothetical protein